ncbi:MAG: 16S rRNA (cytidine(1402)-2'-O)-methyltransferase [Halopseudomonas yangmingensis]|uniref:Ribosomal RNA small subunit methyltransferase I n=1 Tax=Halopseudomonas yangmingensis TaxID=1720063 RepID=A0A1I4R926_9GAMM|nr:16S rRNA (cytidine(1402)-2'-O)-methyltransferase [Halopseudomonas yangmingensis]SFM48761.1 16S rRNA (cytidine1402-2'-O)-methyltransferase [Halopseudomonas yangmingensis]
MNASGTLFVVATPIGNLQDISARAVEVLRSVALIAAEDTRHSARLLREYGIATPLTACHDHNERERSHSLVQRLLAGDDLALISDAGTPLVSDPGFQLVRQAREAGVRVSPVPGPCALIAALSAAGLPSDRFAFEGFLPARSSGRRQRIEALAAEPRTWIIYEAPHRLLECLADLRDLLGGERQVVLAREISKTFETIRGLPLAELHDWVRDDPDQQRGECVLLVEGAPVVSDDSELDSQTLRVLTVLLEELPVKQAAALAARITGVKKNRLYQQALTMQASD